MQSTEMGTTVTEQAEVASETDTVSAFDSSDQTDETQNTEGAAKQTEAHAPYVSQVKESRISKLFNSKIFHNAVVVPLALLLAAFLRFACVQIFTLPYHFAPGGITGIGAMIEYATNGAFSSGWTLIIANVPIVVLAFIFIGKGFAIKSAIAIVISSAGMVVFNHFKELGMVDIPEMFRLNDQPVLAALAAGVLGGLALSIMLKVGSSNGGTDIIGIFIQKKFRATNVAWFISALDASVVVVSFFVLDQGLTPVLLSFTMMFTSATVGDTITSGFKAALKFEIITTQPEELARELIEKLGRGVTMIHSVGMYSHNENALLVCVIRKRQLSEFNKILKQYPNTFAYVTSTSEVMGKGFSSP